MHNKKGFTLFLICVTVCALSFNVLADVIRLNNGASIKGCIIKKTKGFCLLQTPLGTVNFPLNDIKDIKYESPEENLTFLAQGYLINNKFEDAIDYYNQALKKNPDFKQAQNGLKEAKMSFEKHKSHLRKLYEKQQALKGQLQKKIKDFYGLEVEKDEQGLRVLDVLPDGPAAYIGLKSQDIIIALNLENLSDFNSVDAYKVVFEGLKELRYLCFYRRYTIEHSEIRVNFKNRKGLGIILIERKDSIEVDEVIRNSPAQAAGIKEQDKLIELNGVNVKNLSLKAIASITGKSNKVDLVIVRCLKMEE